MTPSVAVIIASLGRPENLAALLKQLERQTQLPSRVVLSMETEADAPPEADHPFPVERVYGPRGMTVQRNRGLDLLGAETDIVVFYDDDFVPSRTALSRMAEFFRRNPEVAGATGNVLQDGIKGPGITPAEAAEIVATYDAKHEPPDYDTARETHGLYGCNMAYRMSMIDRVRFDENLPLYAWLEDLDFGARITAGSLVACEAFAGVHCGEKRGREKNGRKLGYSQIANPFYMQRKGTLSAKIAWKSALKLTVVNHVRILHPEPWVDRWGRAAGNRLAIFDLIFGRARPDRILEF